MECEYSFGKLSYGEVLGFLLKTDSVFSPPLSFNVVLSSYSRKLSDYSEFSIARIDGEIIGMISCYTNNPPIGYISNVCVESDYQGQGLFSRLFSLLLYEVKKRGIQSLFLEVDEGNSKAKGVYSHLGFIGTGQVKTIGKELLRFDIE